MRGCFVRILLFLAATIVLIGIFGLAAFYFVKAPTYQITQTIIDRIDQPAGDSDRSSVFIVEKGEAAGQIADRLEKQGLVKNANVFKLLAMYYGVSSSLEAGDYELEPSMTATEIISKLHRGTVKTVKMTIPEGWRIEQIATQFDKQGIFQYSEFMNAVKSDNYNYSFLTPKPKGTTLEGYLFPDTYNIFPTMKAEDFVDLQLRTLDSRFTDGMRAEASAEGLSFHQVLTLASIVERETAVPSERPLIAGVYLNRLKKGMLLQADPTVQYALANNPTNLDHYGYWKKGLVFSDLNVESPYNTYEYKGLPPGPIANPGLDSIKAVLEPTVTEDLYFVAKPDGSHAFARTLEEHNQNVAKYAN